MIPNLTPSQVYNVINDLWSLIRQANVYEVRAESQKLVQQIESQIVTEDAALLRILAHACFVSGYAASMNTRNRESQSALDYFHQMEETARLINDPVLLSIALTYEGDTFRRLGDTAKAFTHLQAAYDISPHIDMAAHGNCAQLLGRIYLRMNDVDNFERLMVEAEEIADTISLTQNSIQGQYNLGTVYIEYARAYNKCGNISKAMNYLDLAATVLPSTPHWQTLLLATRAILLTMTGDIREGLPLALKSVRLCNEHGNKRLLERLYMLQRFLEQKTIEASKAAVLLNEALHGPFDL